MKVSIIILALRVAKSDVFFLLFVVTGAWGWSVAFERNVVRFVEGWYDLSSTAVGLN